MVQTYDEYSGFIFFIRNNSYEVIHKFMDYKDMTLKGRFEAMIFCGVYFLAFRFRNHPDLQNLSNAYFRELVNQWKKYQIGYWEHFKLAGIINKRTELYREEIRNLYSGGLPGKTYSGFYETPLQSSLEFTEDMLSLITFMPVLAEQLRFMSELKP